MTEEAVVNLGREALMTVLLVGAPMLGLGLLAGLVVSIFQATTQIYEQTLVFVPKIVAVLVAVMLFGPWMVRTMVAFTERILVQLPNMIR